MHCIITKRGNVSGFDQQGYWVVMVENQEIDSSVDDASAANSPDIPLPGAILGMKLYRPPLPQGHIARPRLLDRLNQSPCRLIVISAPAGFGKSTLAIEWLEQLPDDHSVAWLSLDERDNNLQRFLTYLVHTLSRCLDEGAGDASLEQLEAHQTHQPLSFELVLAPLLEEIAQLKTPLVLVLDDYHAINRQAVHKCMTFLFDHLPPNVRLMLTSRYQMGVALSRYRLNRQLEELSEEELRFNHHEVESYLLGEGFSGLSVDDIALVEARSEGWITGLRLFVMAVSREVDPSQHIRALKGTEQFIADYLLEEVFARLGDELREFLLDTVLLDSFNAKLCNAVAQRDDSRELLEMLRSKGVFLVPLNHEGTWFRYHHLFAEFLIEQSKKRGSLHNNLIWGRASRWFHERGQMQQSVDYALRANDLEGASRLVQGLSEEQLLAEQNLSQLLSWRSELPETLILSNPRLVVVYSWALALSYQLDEAERLVSSLEHQHLEGDDFYAGHALAIRAVILRGRSELSRAEESARQALQRLPYESYGARIMSLSVLCNSYLNRGELDKAREYNRQSIEEAQRSGSDLFELLMCFDQATLMMARGNLDVAVRHIDEYSKRLYRDIDTTSLGRLYMQKGLALWQQQDLEEAESWVRRGIPIAEKARDVSVVLGYTVRIMIYRNRRDLGAAFNMLALVERLMNLWDIPQVFYLAWLTALKCDLWIYQGKLDLARSWLERLIDLYDKEKVWPPPYFHFLPGLVRLIYCRLLMADGEPLTAAEAAHRAAERCRRQNFPTYQGVALLYEAAARDQAGERALADERLLQSIALLEPERVIFAFRELGDALVPVLQRQSSNPFAQRMLKMLVPEQSEHQEDSSERRLLELNRQLNEPISKREMAVLQLISEGLSNQQIADKLFISLHTVKTHARRINNKLEVRSRTQAAARARELGLV
ncbi:LuxR C-terminal-related transcriptional regulator [Aestuariirhabdus sp. Z084]|uniref:LuxR C-terminal-related transcriptional regulator n=1 Tax=Aestuariirhabdus haliotis TaxID=2918751 RepID=UPI00201B3751|nr:LuxR C-terminal-related transcriptional regulator [Aestuariirhabdus haliotis]MCL6417803.1 LuxR C-terminal-related transcriptional regulator [Aestuariirhabdus haliotis]MCL6421728.1 LuxR C-terminal-related transcriptional regulator [Aestuariirhabdus haliotis]